MGDFKKRDTFTSSKPRTRSAGVHNRTNTGSTRTYTSRPSSKVSRSSESFAATCAKCGTQCQVPFRPVATRPVYCSACFDKPMRESARGDARCDTNRRNVVQSRPESHVQLSMPADTRAIQELKKEIALLHTKLDTLITLVRRGEKRSPDTYAAHEERTSNAGPSVSIADMIAARTKKAKKTHRKGDTR